MTEEEKQQIYESMNLENLTLPIQHMFSSCSLSQGRLTNRQTNTKTVAGKLLFI